MPRPRAAEWLQDEVQGWSENDVSVVVSLLEGEEIYDLGLAEEANLCRFADIEFLSFPIPDRGVPPDASAARGLADRLLTFAQEGKAVAIHCRAGIGRSSLVAAMTLILSGLTANEALEAIGAARGLDVPDTDEQRRWLIKFDENHRPHR